MGHQGGDEKLSVHPRLLRREVWTARKSGIAGLVFTVRRLDGPSEGGEKR